jgi:hypothetical protein
VDAESSRREIFDGKWLEVIEQGFQAGRSRPRGRQQCDVEGGPRNEASL